MTGNPMRNFPEDAASFVPNIQAVGRRRLVGWMKKDNGHAPVYCWQIGGRCYNEQGYLTQNWPEHVDRWEQSALEEAKQAGWRVPRSEEQGIVTTNTLTYAELSTVLAALRHFQDTRDDLVDMPHFEGVEALTVDEIDSLCERLNCGQIVTITEGPKR